MSPPSELSRQRLRLLKTHSQEWQIFYETETETRLTLWRIHQQQRDRLHIPQVDRCALALLILQQASELLEWRVIHQERRWRLKAQQNQEKVALLTDSLLFF